MIYYLLNFRIAYIKEINFYEKKILIKIAKKIIINKLFLNIPFWKFHYWIRGSLHFYFENILKKIVSYLGSSSSFSFFRWLQLLWLTHGCLFPCKINKRFQFATVLTRRGYFPCQENMPVNNIPPSFKRNFHSGCIVLFPHYWRFQMNPPKFSFHLICPK